MPKKLPVKYFPDGYIARITRKKLTASVEREAKRWSRPYFDTWEEAHEHLTNTAIERAGKIAKEYASAFRLFDRVRRMKPPSAAPTTEPNP